MYNRDNYIFKTKIYIYYIKNHLSNIFEMFVAFLIDACFL